MGIFNKHDLLRRAQALRRFSDIRNKRYFHGTEGLCGAFVLSSPEKAYICPRYI